MKGFPGIQCSSRRLAIMAGLAAFLCLDPGLAAEQALIFRNGDRLLGTMESFAPEDGVLWRHPDAVDVIPFRSTNLAEIRLGAESVPKPSGKHRCEVRLNNGDTLTGNLVSLDATNLVLETWYAGKLEISRNQIHLLTPFPDHLKELFSGPKGIEDWTIGDVSVDKAGVWSYANGGFYASKAASIARTVGLPDMAILEFDLAWRETFNLAVALYNDYLQPISLRNKEDEPSFGGFYSLQISPRSAQLLLVTQDQPLKYLGPLAVRNFDGKNSAHIEVRIDKVQRTITLFVDGDLVKQWKDDGPFGGAGRAIRLVHQGQGSCRIRNLRVRQWDGRFTRPPMLSPTSNFDLVVTTDNRNGMGEVRSLSGGAIDILQSGKLFHLPWTNVVQLEFSRVAASPVPEKTSPDVRAWFDRQRHLSLRLESWKDGRLTGTNLHLERIELDVRALKRVEFLHP